MVKIKHPKTGAQVEAAWVPLHEDGIWEGAITISDSVSDKTQVADDSLLVRPNQLEDVVNHYIGLLSSAPLKDAGGLTVQQMMDIDKAPHIGVAGPADPTAGTTATIDGDRNDDSDSDAEWKQREALLAARSSLYRAPPQATPTPTPPTPTPKQRSKGSVKGSKGGVDPTDGSDVAAAAAGEAPLVSAGPAPMTAAAAAPATPASRPSPATPASSTPTRPAPPSKIV